MEIADHPPYALSEDELEFVKDQIINVKKIGNAAKACNILSKSPDFNQESAELLITYYKKLSVHVNSVEQTAPPLNVPLHLPLILPQSKSLLLKPAEDSLLRCVENADRQVRAAGASPLTHQIKSADLTQVFDALWNGMAEDLNRWRVETFWRRSTVYGFNLAVTILELLLKSPDELPDHKKHAEAIATRLFERHAKEAFLDMDSNYSECDKLMPLRTRWDKAYYIYRQRYEKPVETSIP